MSEIIKGNKRPNWLNSCWLQWNVMGQPETRGQEVREGGLKGAGQEVVEGGLKGAGPAACVIGSRQLLTYSLLIPVAQSTNQ